MSKVVVKTNCSYTSDLLNDLLRIKKVYYKVLILLTKENIKKTRKVQIKKQRE